MKIPPAGPGVVERSDERLDVRAYDMVVGVTLGLHVDDIQGTSSNSPTV
jgi:hypothetical protein